jgi:hypothetical protein
MRLKLSLEVLTTGYLVNRCTFASDKKNLPKYNSDHFHIHDQVTCINENNRYTTINEKLNLNLSTNAPFLFKSL